MPNVVLRNRHEKAVLWPATGGVDAYGQQRIGDPVEIRVRALSNQADRKERLNPLGNTVLFDALFVVAQEIPVGSLMWQGSIEDIPGTALTPESDLLQVVSYDETPNLKARVSYREVGCMRYKGSLPG